VLIPYRRSLTVEEKMRGSLGFLALLLVFTQLAPATAGEVFVAQSANRKLSFDKVKTLVARDAGLLASPLPLSTFKPPSQAASNTGTGASTGNVSSVTQYGTNNLAVVAQASAANQSAVMQHGSGNTALVTQRSGH
jgi:hypothetical protein